MNITDRASELRNCVKVEVAVLGIIVHNSPYGLCERKATLNLTGTILHEPVWPSGKALYKLVSRGTSVRFRFGFPLSSYVDTVV